MVGSDWKVIPVARIDNNCFVDNVADPKFDNVWLLVIHERAGVRWFGSYLVEPRSMRMYKATEYMPFDKCRCALGNFLEDYRVKRKIWRAIQVHFDGF